MLTMQLVVHRGAREIGGSCIEVSNGGSRLILDVGLTLDETVGAATKRPSVRGLFAEDGPPITAVLLSHAHPDHSGLLETTRSEIPVYMTRGTSKMLDAGCLFARLPSVPGARRRMLAPGKVSRIGDFLVTALLVDHSIYGAAGFLIQANGQRVLYTGDLRFHGRKPGMQRSLIRAAARGPLDALIVEGTRLGSRAGEGNVSEETLQAAIAEDVRRTAGTCLAMYSPLNVDRFVTFYKAATKTGRLLVVDPYQTHVLHLIRRQTAVPLPGQGALRLMVPPRFAASRAGRALLKKPAGANFNKGLVTREEILANPSRYVVLFRASMQPWLFPDGFPSCTTCIFSYWGGYFEKPELRQLEQDIASNGGTFFRRHVSGHAHRDDLKSLVEALRPRRVCPVHGDEPERWAELWPSAAPLEDEVPVEIL